jgi:Domain of unknown function (DUF4304)
MDAKRSSWSKSWDFLRNYLPSSEVSVRAATPRHHAKTLNVLLKRLKPFLKAHGFRGRGRNFNRVTSDGLRHVISFQMGRDDPPGTLYLPGLTENLFGQFTVNLGVFIPETQEMETGLKATTSVAEVQCSIRTRLGELGPENDDLWWPICEDADLVAELEDRFCNDAFPFFAEYETRELCLIRQDITDARGFDISPRITSAFILNARGETRLAKQLLFEQMCSALNHGYVAHATFVNNISLRLGLGGLKDQD